MLSASRGLKMVVFAAVLGSAAAWVALAQQPRKVDDAALRDAARTGEEWITYNLGWSEQRYSPLNQINASEREPAGTRLVRRHSRCRARQSAKPAGRHAAGVSTACSTASRRGASCMPSTPRPAKKSGIPTPT